MEKAAFSAEHPGVLLHFAPAIELSDEQFLAFCRQNQELRIERTADGEIIIMAPTGGSTGARNADFVFQLTAWAREDGTGIAFDSSAGFDLPRGGTRAPDVAWVRKERLATLTAEEKEKFLPLCPDFAVELRSPSDTLQALQDKMEEYLENGCRLGWLIDPAERRVHAYRPDQPAEVLKAPGAVSGDPVLPDFTLDLGPIWDPDL